MLTTDIPKKDLPRGVDKAWFNSGSSWKRNVYIDWVEDGKKLSAEIVPGGKRSGDPVPAKLLAAVRRHFPRAERGSTRYHRRRRRPS